MSYIFRQIEKNIKNALARDKSILLFGARQTGKTTMLEHIPADLRLTFVLPEIRFSYEKNPSKLIQEIAALNHDQQLPLIIIDEVQKVPEILDVVQYLIDNKRAKFVLTGSSARKLKHNKQKLNLLPGRVVVLELMPLAISELPSDKLVLNDLLLYGSLPGIVTLTNNQNREEDLHSYVTTYLEEEIRQEAAVRNLAAFVRFLELAAIESGYLTNFSKLSQEIGVTRETIANYYAILEDCLIGVRVDPLTQSQTRKRLIKSSKYLLFDLGVRRLCAAEGDKPPQSHLGLIFEQFIGLELIRAAKLNNPYCEINFWSDPSGPEVDWVINKQGQYIPIEVKLTPEPNLRNAKHLQLFCEEYPNTENAYVVCTATRKMKLAERVFAIPWQEIGELVI